MEWLFDDHLSQTLRTLKIGIRKLVVVEKSSQNYGIPRMGRNFDDYLDVQQKARGTYMKLWYLNAFAIFDLHLTLKSFLSTAAIAWNSTFAFRGNRGMTTMVKRCSWDLKQKRKIHMK